MIYLASPYSHKSATIRQFRYSQALLYATQQMAKGVTLFSPIVYGHHFTLTHKIGSDHLTWQTFNDHMLICADAMHVLHLAGWEESNGIKYELSRAEEIGLPVLHIKDWP